MSEGRKDDTGKIQPSIVLGDFSRALIEVCKAGETGIQRYGPSNWLNVPEARKRYENALLRHWLSSKTERLDPDSKLSHLAHVAWNALAILELELRRLEQQEAPLYKAGISGNMSAHVNEFKFNDAEEMLINSLPPVDREAARRDMKKVLELKVVELEKRINEKQMLEHELRSNNPTMIK